MEPISLPMHHSALIPHVKRQPPPYATPSPPQPPSCPLLRPSATGHGRRCPLRLLPPRCPSSFRLIDVVVGSRATTAGSVLPQAAAVFTDELPPDLKPSKADLEPPPSNLLPATATLLSLSFCCHHHRLTTNFKARRRLTSVGRLTA
jgi:hypothetical protein